MNKPETFTDKSGRQWSIYQLRDYAGPNRGLAWARRAMRKVKSGQWTPEKVLKEAVRKLENKNFPPDWKIKGKNGKIYTPELILQETAKNGHQIGIQCAKLRLKTAWKNSEFATDEFLLKAPTNQRIDKEFVPDKLPPECAPTWRAMQAVGMPGGISLNEFLKTDYTASNEHA